MMTRCFLSVLLVAGFLALAVHPARAADGSVIISEFMADNGGVITDGHGAESDWIELQNTGATAINLLGWHLTDDATQLGKWTFPSVNLTAGQSLIVFASGLGLPDPGGFLHTNFKLSTEGSYLALVRPDGTTIVTEFAPAYPPQRRNVSYGVAEQVLTTSLVGPGTASRLRIPSASDAGLGTTWTGGAEPFADSSWSAGPAAIGFDGVALTSTNVVNVAQGKPVIAAGDTWGGLPKENLTDGNLTTFTHNLTPETAFYFIVDLGATHALANIELFNRSDGCCPERLSNFTISLLADAGPTPGPVVWSANIRTNNSNSGVSGRDLITPTLDTNGLFAGRWIKVQARDNGTTRYFQIAELRANVVNWVGGATVTTTGPTWAGLPASNLIDGNLGTVSHNLDLTPAFAYQVRLTQSIAFERIELWNRGDGCCPDRLSNYRVTIHADDAGSLGPVWWSADVRTDGSNPGVGGVDAITAAADPSGRFEGQWIQVQNIDNGVPRFLQLAEVRAFGSAGSSGYAPLWRRDVSAVMKGVSASAWLRVPFATTGSVDQLTLRMRYDDGFRAFLNGTEIAGRNTPAGQLAWDSAAPTSRFAGAPEEFAVPASLLHDGTNILAIHALNVSAGDRDFLLVSGLTSRKTLLGTNGYFVAPTPGAINSSVTVSGFVQDTSFSVDRGFFDTPFDVVISCPTPGATLVYTTNNSTPTLANGVAVPAPNSLTGPTGTVRIVTTTALRAAAFKTGLQPADVDTHTYLFLQDVIRQPANPPGQSPTWDAGAADYAMDPKVTTNVLYRDEIVADLRSIPTLSIVLPNGDLFGSAAGIYYNSSAVGDNWERAASVELIRPDGTTGFQENCGVRIWGTGWRPNATTPKHSLQLKFKREYGAGHLNYPLFPLSPVSEFDNIVLRAQGSRGWTDFRAPDIDQSQYIHDGWARDSAQAMGKFDGAATYVHLYLNGLYWGLYNPVEKTDEGFAEIHYGHDKSEYDVITRRGAPEVDAGTLDAWNQMMTVVNGGLTNADQYALLQQYLDVDDFIDYMMLHQYASNHDGPLNTIANNMRAIRRRAPGEQFRFYVWDMEYTFWYPQEFNLAFDLDQCPARIFQRLRTNPEFRLRWADHAQKHLLNGGALTPGPAAARWQARAQELVGAIVGESARWGDVRRNPPYTRNVEWTNELNRLLYEYFPVRAEILLNQYRLAGLYTTVVPPSFNQPGGDVPPNFAARLDAPAGTIYYTVDGTDPRLSGGGLAPSGRSHVPTTALVSSNSLLRVAVPSADSLGTSWRNLAFNDSDWLVGPNAAGFDVSVPVVAVTVPLQNASADFSEAGRSANLAIDTQLTTGWGIFENQSYLPKGRGAVAVFETVTNVGYLDGTALTFTLRFGASGQLALGKFRISATTDDRVQFADGLANRGDIIAAWLPLQPSAATAAGGATVTINPDATLTIGGTNPATNTYVVTVLTPMIGITGFRLEALEDGSLPSNGPGRASNGNAVLTDFVVQAAPATISHLPNATLGQALRGEMLGGNPSAYLRFPFDQPGGLAVDRLLLRVRYEDGFIAYLNGQEIARRNAPVGAAWNSSAQVDREKRMAFDAEEIDVSAARSHLIPGANVLAFQAMNSQVSSPDFLLIPELIAKTDLAVPVIDTLTIRSRVLSGSTWSALNEATFSARSPLRISEIMYDPPDAPGISGDEFEFLELQNAGTTPYSVGQFTFTSGINYTFPPGTVLAPGQFYVLVRNPAAVASRYAGLIPNGVYTGRLDNQGETITLSRPFNGGVVLSVTYNNSAAWPQTARGFGFSIVPTDVTFGGSFSDPTHWRASSARYGSPGGADPASIIPPIRINEILSATTPPQTDFIELFNPTVNPVNVGGWFLTDDAGNPYRYRIPDGTTIVPGGYLVLNESNFNANPGASNSFTLSSHGEVVVLYSGGASTNLTGYSHAIEFEPAADGVSFGRYVNSTGEEHFPAQLTITSNAPNSGPRIGPVILGEIHYHPAGTADEFIELRNITGAAVDLFDRDHPTNTWRINGLDFVFPTGVSLSSSGRALVVGITPSVFRTKHAVPSDVPIFGPWAGTLQDSGERLELKRPDAPDTNGLFYITIDAVRYNDRAPWPLLADGYGPSLQRRVDTAYGDEPTNWVASAPSPGRAPAGGTSPVILVGPTNQTVPQHGQAAFMVSASGTAPLFYQWRHAGTNLPGATNATLPLSDVLTTQAGIYSAVVYNAAGSVESSGAALSVFPAASIVSQPRTAFVRPGSNATFSVYATSTLPFTLQWFFNGIEIPNATNASLLITNAGPAQQGVYTVRVTDPALTVVSAPAHLVLLLNPLIIQSPVSQSVAPGASTVLSVRVTNNATLPVGYIWRRGSSPIAFQESTQTFAYFVLTNLQTTAIYTVVATNAAQPIGNISTSATITILVDTDGDGLPDAWELANGLDPNSAADAASDRDGDTMSNRAEYVAGTDPQDGTSYLKVEQPTPQSPAVLTFNAISNRTYSVEYTDALPGGASWRRLSDFLATSTNRLESVTDVSPGARRTYRLVTPRQ